MTSSRLHACMPLLLLFFLFFFWPVVTLTSNMIRWETEIAKPSGASGTTCQNCTKDSASPRCWIETGLRLQAVDKQQSVLRQWLVTWPSLICMTKSSSHWIETGLRLQAVDKQQSVLRQWELTWALLMHHKINQSLGRDRAATASNGQTAVCLETVRGTWPSSLCHKVKQSLDRDRATHSG